MHLVQSWHTAVLQFSGLKLSYDSDRLVAIAALAQDMMQVRQSDTYLAGMWKDSMVYDLQWMAPLAEHRHRPTVAASIWFWLSFNVMVGFEEYTMDYYTTT